MSTAGILLFIHKSCGEEIRERVVDFLTGEGRVSDEVLSVYWVKPTRQDVIDLCNIIKQNPALDSEVELLERLRANNALKDLTASWRLQSEIIDNFYLLVGLETVNPLFRHKYPIPNLTLQAGSVESGERPIDGAVREMYEEARIRIDKNMIRQRAIGLLRGGMLMYPCYIFNKKHIKFNSSNKTIYISDNETPSVVPHRRSRVRILYNAPLQLFSLF